MSSQALSVRLLPPDRERLEALAGRLAVGLVPVTRHAILREVIHRGLALIERQLDQPVPDEGSTDPR
jgi:hypothetical protein